MNNKLEWKNVCWKSEFTVIDKQSYYKKLSSECK